MKVGIKKPEARLHSGQWKAICGLLVMVAAISIVWAVLVTFTLKQRDSELVKAAEELNDLREDIRQLQQQYAPHSIDMLVPDDDYTPPPDPIPDMDDDPFAIFEDDSDLLTDEE